MKTLRIKRASLASCAGLGLLAGALATCQARASAELGMSPEPVPRALASQARATTAPAAAPASKGKRADFRGAAPSDESRQLADWILASNNHRSLPFLIVDKKQATVYAFHADGQLRSMSPALLGSAVGDDSVPGIGQRKLSAIRPAERTTPAGRFVASLGRNLQGVDILWVDYDAAISLHRVVTNVPKERRAQRLASPTPLDNRISYGCINVPVEFFDRDILPVFKGTKGIVYVLPETRSAREVFGSHDVDGQPALPAVDEG